VTAGGLHAVFMAQQAALLRFLRARGAGDAAEDVLHDLWLKLEAAPAQGPVAEPLAYLYRAADNLMLDRRRSAVRRTIREDAWGEAADGAEPGVSDAPSADRVLASREELRRVQAALDALGARTAAIFRRHRVDGLGQRDIAAEEGISLSAVEKHLQKAYRALVALRMDSGEYGDGDAG